MLELGRTVVTAGVAKMMKDNKNFTDFVKASLNKHTNGDWGNVCKEDKELNDNSNGPMPERILSSYEDKGIKIWIITEWDRSVTTILLPEEY